MRKLNYVFLLLCVVLATSCVYANTKTIKNVKVINKERIITGRGDAMGSFYLIYTDKGEYTVKDELFRGNFNASTWYGKLQKGNCYDLVVGGYRSVLLSMYQNIHVDPKQVSCE